MIKRCCYLLTLFAAAIFAGCEIQRETVQDVPTQQPATTTVETSQPSPSAEPTTKAPEQAITLPVIDALFADESFAADAKSKAGLTDEQINKLKERSRNDVLEINEDDTGSTRAAVSKAQKEIREI